MSSPGATQSRDPPGATANTAGAVGLRPLLLRAATRDFIAQDSHEPEELRRFVELAGHLMDDAEEADVGELASALLLQPDAPPEILQRILQRGGAPGRKILRRDPRLTAEALQDIARTGACAEAAAIALRKDLDDHAVAALLARPEREIWRRLAENRALRFSPSQWGRLIARGRDDATLASALLDRDDAPRPELAPLFLHATTSQRAQILAEAQRTASLGAAPGAKKPFWDKMRAATPALLRAQKPGALALALARALDAEFFRARRLVADASGEALMLALRALGLDAVDIDRLLAAAAPRLRARENFGAALELVDAVPRKIALRLVSALLAPAARRPRPKKTYTGSH